MGTEARLGARYLIETPISVERAAEVLAGEQSSGTFVKVPGESDDLRHRFAARVERVEMLDAAPQPALPGSRLAKGAAANGTYQRAIIDISWSLDNFGANLPTIVSTTQGNLFELAQFSGIRLLDLQVPPELANQFRGPAFGAAGTRQQTAVFDRPLIGTIVKPSVGLRPTDTASLVRTLASAGIDFIKDDELMANPPHSPFDERVEAVMAVLRDHHDRTGQRIMYAFNISDELDAMQHHYEKIVACGGTCAMMSLNAVGISAAKKIADRGELVIHGHRNGWGALTRYPLLGLDFPAYHVVWRLAGVDQLHVNGIDNKFYESNESVLRSIRACRSDGLPGNRILPVVSSGQWGGQAPETYRLTQTLDLLYMAGGGIMAHPDGPAAGVRSLRAWWEAAVEGLDVRTAVERYPELSASFRMFGNESE